MLQRKTPKTPSFVRADPVLDCPEGLMASALHGVRAGSREGGMRMAEMIWGAALTAGTAAISDFADYDRGGSHR